MSKVYGVIVVIFIFIGSTLKVDLVWALADCFNGLMVIPNLLGILALSPLISKLTKDYNKQIKDIEDVAVVVTIITDGYENASKEYNGSSIKALVEKLRKEGWTFTYMGANQDSMEVAMSMSIRNARNFDYSSEGTRASMRKDTTTRMNFFSRLSQMKNEAYEIGRFGE